jgi:prophage regulatory protein
MAKQYQETLLRRKQVEARCGISRSSIYDAIQRNAFPRPVKLIGRTVAWTESSIDKWIAERVAACSTSAGDDRQDTSSRRQPEKKDDAVARNLLKETR